MTNFFCISSVVSNVSTFFAFFTDFYFVPSYTNSRFVTNDRRGKSPEAIFFYGNRFKVIWINAISSSAKMIQYQSLRNFSFNRLIRKPMGLYVAAIRLLTKMKVTVPFHVGLSCPYPAIAKIGSEFRNRTTFVNFFPESYIGVFFSRLHSLCKSPQPFSFFTVHTLMHITCNGGME